MGILKTREEYLPVTCAILKPEDRDAFFSAVKKAGGHPEAVARHCDVTVEMANEWISGKANVPYHSLQTLAHQYTVAMPAVGELRREYLAVSQAPSRRETPTPPRPSKRTQREAKSPREPSERQPRKERAAKPQRERQQPRQEKRRSQHEPRAPHEPRAQHEPRRPQREQRGKQAGRKAPPPLKGPHVPEPSEAFAYWVGITLLTGRREGAELIMSADRRIGQNFAGAWANLTRDLFGVKPALKMLDEGKAQEAALPVAGFEECLDRLDLKEGKPFNEAGVPRWAWSNPAWKAACLKGIVDARASFQRAPAIVLEGLPERLGRAVQKMLAAFKLEAVIAENGAIELKGAEAIELYFEKVGTGNMKLRDQYRAFTRPRGGRPPREGAEEAVADSAPAPADAERPATAEGEASEAGEEEKGRVLAEEVEAADEEAEIQNEALTEALGSEPGADESLEAAIDAAAAAKAAASAQPSRFAPPPPQPKEKQPPHRRRTLFRGRPKR